MKPYIIPSIAALAIIAGCGLSHADVLYSFAGPQLVSDNNAFPLPGLSLSRSATATGTLYFKYTITNPASNRDTEPYYAGMSFYEAGNERLGIGNGWGAWAYSAFGPGVNVDFKSATPEPGNAYQEVRATDTTTIVVRVDFNNSANENITVWLNPNLAVAETEQNPALTTTFTTNANFDNIYLREGGEAGAGWTFSDFAIAENSTDAGFFAVPNTTAIWNGEGSNSNWSTTANWDNSLVPATGFDLIFPATTNAAPVNDLAAEINFTGITFPVGAPPYLLSGNAISLSGELLNNSAAPHTFTMPIVLDGPLTFATLNASLYVYEAISGPHGIIKSGGNRLELTADNTYTGNTSINGGTLSIGNGDTAGSIDPTSTLIFGAGATNRLEIFRSDDITLANPITTDGRANITVVSGSKVNLSGPITGAEELWTYGPGIVQITPNFGSASFVRGVVIATGTLEIADFSTSTLGTGQFFIGQAGSGTLRYTGPSTSTDRVAAYALQGAGTNTVIEITSPTTELTFTQPLDDNDPFGGKGLTKAGPGTLTLVAAQAYTGDTVVEEGELSLTQPGFSDTSTVTISDNGQLRLEFFGSDTVTGIVFGPNVMGPGTYTAVSHPNYISGTGSLVIPSTATPYEIWGSTYGLSTGSEGGDLDNDGLSNFHEYAFGLIPNRSASATAIAVLLDKTTGTFSYTRRAPSLTGLSYSVWYSTNLSGWSQDTGAVEGSPVVNGEVETVPVTLGGTLLTNPSLFIQIRAE